ncbi:hypothetical protein CUMW_022690 [Citrus unshiu]|nr:hypothetical protein CUMW_022690 [Citrus unshiu]
MMRITVEILCLVNSKRLLVVGYYNICNIFSESCMLIAIKSKDIGRSLAKANLGYIWVTARVLPQFHLNHMGSPVLDIYLAY